MIRVTENWSGRSFRSGVSATRVFIVTGTTSESEAARARDAITGVQVPPPLAGHPRNVLMRAKQPTVTWIGPAGQFEVKVEYYVPTGFPPGEGMEVLQTPVLYEWDDAITSEPADVDIDGRPILNSAHDPFEAGLSYEYVTLWLTVRRWESTFDIVQSTMFRNAVNSDPVNVRGAGAVAIGCMCCRSIRPASAYEPEAARPVEVVYRFELRAPTSQIERDGKASPFDHRLLDVGFGGWYASPNDAPYYRRGDFYAMEGGKPVRRSDPVRLDGSGKPFESGVFTVGGSNVPVTYPYPVLPADQIERTDKGVFLRYRKHKRIDFAALDLFA